jgi:hypothetical protein
VDDRGIEPHIPVIDESGREDQTFARADFAYDHAADQYVCPGGKLLQRYRRAFAEIRTDAPSDGTYRYGRARPTATPAL